MPKRILILGCAGAGKTTLARRAADALGASLIGLDAIWQADWGLQDLEHFRRLLREAHSADAWVSDGNFAEASFDIRLPRADLVAWLEYPRLACARSAIARVLRPGETHRLRDLPKVLRFIRNFDRINRPRIEAALRRHGQDVPVLRLRGRRETAAFLSSLEPG